MSEVTLDSLDKEVQALHAELYKLSRQANSRRGPEGPAGRDSTVPGPKGEPGRDGFIKSREEAVVLFREVLNQYHDEIIDGVFQEFRKRLRQL